MKPLDQQTEPEEIEIARKITLFRVVVARKLGIDYEHSQHSEEFDEKRSLQTNQFQDGVADLMTVTDDKTTIVLSQ